MVLPALRYEPGKRHAGGYLWSPREAVPGLSVHLGDRNRWSARSPGLSNAFTRASARWTVISRGARRTWPSARGDAPIWSRRRRQGANAHRMRSTTGAAARPLAESAPTHRSLCTRMSGRRRISRRDPTPPTPPPPQGWLHRQSRPVYASAGPAVAAAPAQPPGGGTRACGGNPRLRRSHATLPAPSAGDHPAKASPVPAAGRPPFDARWRRRVGPELDGRTDQKVRSSPLGWPEADDPRSHPTRRQTLTLTAITPPTPFSALRLIPAAASACPRYRRPVSLLLLEHQELGCFVRSPNEAIDKSMAYRAPLGADTSCSSGTAFPAAQPA